MELVDFRGIFKSFTERLFFWVFILLYAAFSLNLFPSDLLLVLALVVFLFSPIRVTFFQFVFYTLWEYVSVLSNGITLNFLFQVVLFIKILIYIVLNYKWVMKSKISRLTLLFSGYLFINALFNYLSWNSFTGFGLFFKSFFCVYCCSFYYIKEKAYLFWKTVFHVILLSSLLSVIFGMNYDTSIDRYISGLENNYVSQLYGTLGTTRLGVFLVVSLIFPLYFMKNKKIKILLIALLIVLAFMTVSLTTIILLFILITIFLLYKNVKWYKLFVTLIFLLTILIFTFPLWSKISFIEPVAARIEFSLEMSKSGDFTKATSNRSDLSEFYMHRFFEGDILTQCFGQFKTSANNENEMFAHNSYIDFLFYAGFFGCLFFFYLVYRKIKFFWSTELFYPIVSLKIVFLVVAFTVSIFSSSFWMIYLLM